MEHFSLITMSYIYHCESEGICFHLRWFVCMSVCLSVTTITKKIVDGFAPNIMHSCFVTIGKGMWK